jgi:excisionase family DNA binding protein
MNLEPYSLSVADASQYFGVSKQTFYQSICNNELQMGFHYLKFGKKVLLKPKAIKQWIHERSGVIYYGEDESQQMQEAGH